MKRTLGVVVATVVSLTLAAKDQVLFFGAHPDDFEACMGLALRMRSDFDVSIVDFTRGEGGCGEEGFRDGSTGRKREAEEREVAKAFGTEPVFLSQVNFKGRYAFANEKVTGEIEDLLLACRPKAVFTHWPLDTHPDHVQCSAAVQHALFNVRRDHRFKTELYFYEVPPWETMNFRPAYHVDITDEIALATNLICKYVCQNGAKIARDKLGRVARQGLEAPVRVAYAERYATFSGRQIPGGVLDRYALKASLRVLHLDFRADPIKRDAVEDCLREAADKGYDAVLWEVADKIRWETYPGSVHPDAITKDEFREILNEARRLHLEPIPLLQAFGRPVGVQKSGGQGPSLRDLLKEYLELFGENVRHFHLGGDGFKAFCASADGSKRSCMERAAKHLKRVAEPLFFYDIKPGVWAEMVQDDPDAFEKTGLSKSFTVWRRDSEGDGNGGRRVWLDVFP